MSDLPITTQQLVNIAAAFPQISGAGMTPTGAFALRCTRPVVGALVTAFEETRIEKAKELAKKNDDGSPKMKTVTSDGKDVEVFDFEDETAWSACYAELMAAKVTLSGVRPITVKEFGHATISEEVMTLLGPLVVE